MSLVGIKCEVERESTLLAVIYGGVTILMLEVWKGMGWLQMAHHVACPQYLPR